MTENHVFTACIILSIRVCVESDRNVDIDGFRNYDTKWLNRLYGNFDRSRQCSFAKYIRKCPYCLICVALSYILNSYSHIHTTVTGHNGHKPKRPQPKRPQTETATNRCGRSGLWPFRFVAVSVCGRLGFGRSGLWPLWPESHTTTNVRQQCCKGRLCVPAFDNVQADFFQSCMGQIISNFRKRVSETR